MGFWNSVFKGVNVEKRTQTVEAPAPMAVNLEQPEITPQAVNQPASVFDVPAFTPDQGTAYQSASSILFGNQNQTPAYSQFANAFGSTTPQQQNHNILVMTPYSNKEVGVIVDHLKIGEPCIVCLEGLPLADSQRRIDFLSGVACALNGNIKLLDSYKYILTPNGVGVKK